MSGFEEQAEIQVEECLKLLEEKEYKELLSRFTSMAYADIADVVEEAPNLAEIIILLYKDSPRNAGRILSYLTESDQLEIFEMLPSEIFAKIFAHMEPDVRVDLFQFIPEDDREAFLPYLDTKTMGNLFLLDKYSPDTAGGIMSTDFITINIEMTVMEVVEQLRDVEHRTHNLFYLYVTDKDQILKGRVSIRDLLIAKRSSPVVNIVKDPIAVAQVDEDQEDVAKKFEKYDLYNIPVTNGEGKLVGLISSDDILDVIREEETEDIEKMMGIAQEKHARPYLESTVYSQFKKRLIWLIPLMLVGFVSGLVVRHFEATLDQYVILAVFMPMIAATGGNVGSQAASVIIRALALDEVERDEFFDVVWKEIRVAVMIAVSLGTLAFGGVLLVAHGAAVPAGHGVSQVAMAISVALFLQIISAIMFGTIFPLGVRLFKGDPALVASPAITTFVDITGLMIYFTTASLMLL